MYPDILMCWSLLYNRSSDKYILPHNVTIVVFGGFGDSPQFCTKLLHEIGWLTDRKLRGNKGWNNCSWNSKNFIPGLAAGSWNSWKFLQQIGVRSMAGQYIIMRIQLWCHNMSNRMERSWTLQLNLWWVLIIHMMLVGGDDLPPGSMS